MTDKTCEAWTVRYHRYRDLEGDEPFGIRIPASGWSDESVPVEHMFSRERLIALLGSIQRALQNQNLARNTPKEADGE